MFNVGDRIRFTRSYLEGNAEYIDPAITDEECRGTIRGIREDGWLDVEFDDGEVESWYSPQAFELIGPDSPSPVG